MAAPRGQRFGGEWTELKLLVLQKYLRAYTTALSRQPFELTYIDAFAGTGYRSPRDEATADARHLQLNLDEAAMGPQEVAGSARLALEIDRPFSEYRFIDNKLANCRALEDLRTEFPDLAHRINVIKGDANQVLRSLPDEGWQGKRAVLFLDPYGLEVRWATMKAIAETRAIDVWLLFPHGNGVNRMLPRNPQDLTAGWRRKLNVIFGTEDWYDHFYGPSLQPSLLPDDPLEPETVKRIRPEGVGAYYLKRLETIFPPRGIVTEPLELRNTRGVPLFLLYFAASNPKPRAYRRATKIARDVIRSVSR